jgi:hypothetical protein
MEKKTETKADPKKKVYEKPVLKKFKLLKKIGASSIFI